MPHTHTCDICATVFDTHYKVRIHCCKRCAYIANKLKLPPAKKMERAEAIEYYGVIFDNPLRLYRGTRYYSILQRILKFCEARGRREFTYSEFMDANPDLSFKPILFGAIERNTKAIKKTGETVRSQSGQSKVAVWRLCV